MTREQIAWVKRLEEVLCDLIAANVHELGVDYATQLINKAKGLPHDHSR